MVEPIIIDIDDITSLFKKILNNDTFSIVHDNIFQEILKNYENIKNENFKLNDKIEQLKLYSSTLRECLDPTDEQLNTYVKKYSILREKYEKLKTYSKILCSDNDNILKEYNNIIIQLKKQIGDSKAENYKIIQDKFNNELQNILLKKVNKMQNVNIDELKNRLKKYETVNNGQNETIDELKKEINEINITNDNIINDNIMTNDTNHKELYILSDSDDSKNYIDISKINNIFTDDNIDNIDNNLINKNANGVIIINNDNLHIFEKHYINKRTQKKNTEFFENEIKINTVEIKNNTGEIKNNYNDISFSTDYMVSLLRDDAKIKPKYSNLIKTIINEDNEYEILNLPHEPKIINNEIQKNTIHEKILMGGKKINKMNIEIINNLKKMVIGGEITTITEQELNLDDKKKVHLIYNKKSKRHQKKILKNV